MYENLISSLSQVKSKYEEGIDVTEKIFDSLKMNDIKALPPLTTIQTECMSEIKIAKEKLKDTLKNIIMKHNIDTDDYRMHHVLYLFTQKQKEGIIDLSRLLHTLEVSLQRALYRNQDMLASIINSTQTVVEAAIDYSENEYSESQLFLNEKF
ncbi:hypothetical protein [Bacillus thuringiensis]|uniref:hypothetical protein n=1 Tax=Bacillus thuringiensis TaxID=1428 RepID=UPI0021D67DB8|nr:hypothetical protein [Bacillus thuringiensis]MCU7667000.1 hypothetical protein [Bacillus thuringiensis]